MIKFLFKSSKIDNNEKIKFTKVLAPVRSRNETNCRGQKKWVTIKTYYDQWRCVDVDCNSIIVYSVQIQELQNNRGEVFGIRQVYDDNNGN